jgi:hypothetical protein
MLRIPPRTQINVRFPRFGTRLNTRRCVLPIQGGITGLRGQAALRARGWAGNPPHAYCPVTFVGVAAALFAVGPAFLALERQP